MSKPPDTVSFEAVVPTVGCSVYLNVKDCLHVWPFGARQAINSGKAVNAVITPKDRSKSVRNAVVAH